MARFCFILEEVEGIFDPVNPYIHVGSRETLSTEGTAISEWRVLKEQVVHFLRHE
jgi:contact-dependent growth inhibition (CDI) system CdiI-like immunity protein